MPSLSDCGTDWSSVIAAVATAVTADLTYFIWRATQSQAEATEAFARITNALKAVVLDGILSIRKEVPVTELARAIGQGDIARLKRHVFEMAYRADVTLEELRLAVEKINTEVKLIESNSERLSRWDIVGVFSGLAGAVVTQDPIQTAFVGAIVKRLLMELPDVRSKHPMVSATLDSIEGIWHKTTPDRILFARVRQRIEAKK